MENENTEVEEEAKTETWQNDSHKKMFGRYSSEWDWHHTACRLDKPKNAPGKFFTICQLRTYIKKPWKLCRNRA